MGSFACAELEGVLLGRSDVLDVGVVPIYKADEATEVPRAYSESELHPST